MRNKRVPQLEHCAAADDYENQELTREWVLRKNKIRTGIQ